MSSVIYILLCTSYPQNMGDDFSALYPWLFEHDTSDSDIVSIVTLCFLALDPIYVSKTNKTTTY